MDDKVYVSYTEGLATVAVDGRSLAVDRRRTKNRSNVCPAELISVALGS
jgi:hypothetical protein